MSQDQREFLMLRIQVGICGFLEASWILRLPIDALIFLERVGHLKALANPPPNAQRYFLISYLLRIAQDQDWAAKAIKLLRDRNRRRNDASKQRKSGNHRSSLSAFTNRRYSQHKG